MTTAKSTTTTVDDIDPGFVPRLADDVVVVEVEDEAVLYHEVHGSLHLLDPIATVVCSRFDGVDPIDAIADQLAEVFGAPRDVIAADVLTMTRRLAGEGLLAGVEVDGEAPVRVEEALVDGCQ